MVYQLNISSLFILIEINLKHYDNALTITQCSILNSLSTRCDMKQNLKIAFHNTV